MKKLVIIAWGCVLIFCNGLLAMQDKQKTESFDAIKTNLNEKNKSKKMRFYGMHCKKCFPPKISDTLDLHWIRCGAWDKNSFVYWLVGDDQWHLGFCLRNGLDDGYIDIKELDPNNINFNEDGSLTIYCKTLNVFAEVNIPYSAVWYDYTIPGFVGVYIVDNVNKDSICMGYYLYAPYNS